MPWNRGRRKTPLLPGKDSENKKSWTLFTVHSQFPLLLVNHSGSVVSDSFATPWNVACWAPLSMEFPRQEYLSGFSFPPSGDLPDPRMEPGSLALRMESLPLIHQDFSLYKNLLINKVHSNNHNLGF